jgi:2,3-bisphosphoglycerate-independent phosphoglycerate mutase
MILDGWGIGDGSRSDVIASGETPNIDALTAKYPHSRLLTCGEDVGLPEGQMGNSEVGHLNIGAGRIVYQDLVKINKAIREHTFENNKEIVSAFMYARQNNKAVHFIGLLSDGGVHSSQQHLHRLCDIAQDYGLERVYIHALMDGRDCDPRSGLGFMKELTEHLKKSAGQVASVCGRYYTMDRDKRWERIKQGYDLLTAGIGRKARSPEQAIENSYNDGVTDEFIKPVIIVDDNNEPIATLEEDDVFFCFNFRTDRLREITTVLSQRDMPEYQMSTIPLYYVTMTRYDDSFRGIHVVYDKDNVEMTIGETLSKLGLSQIRIAETEKYPHVTFFFSGGREKEFPNERRILIPSPKVATYDLQPEMSAYLVKDAIVAELNKSEADFVCLNFANGDMVGHTGVYDAILKAVKTVDECVGEVIAAARANDYDALIIADHGNADYAINEDGTPNTAHSLNPVPCILVSDDYKEIKDGILADVAPTILKVMNIPIPKQMTGKPLVN